MKCFAKNLIRMKLDPDKNIEQIENMRQSYGYPKTTEFTPEMVAISRMMYFGAESSDYEYPERRLAVEQAKECVKRHK